jgi:adenine-specific DNA methylase
MSHPPLLIESWLPIEAIGAESKRERGASSALSPLHFLRNISTCLENSTQS